MEFFFHVFLISIVKSVQRSIPILLCTNTLRAMQSKQKWFYCFRRIFIHFGSQFVHFVVDFPTPFTFDNSYQKIHRFSNYPNSICIVFASIFMRFSYFGYRIWSLGKYALFDRNSIGRSQWKWWWLWENKRDKKMHMAVIRRQNPKHWDDRAANSVPTAEILCILRCSRV